MKFDDGLKEDLNTGDSCAVPAKTTHSFVDWSCDMEMLEVMLG